MTRLPTPTSTCAFWSSASSNQPMANTARTHFDEDLTRAEEMLGHAKLMQDAGTQERLCQDIRIASIATAIGAMDAYLCDKYVDCLTSVLKAYWQGKWRGDLPSFYARAKLPAGFVLDTSRTRRPGWSIRMAARRIMERETILSLSKVDEMFNPILPSGQKIWADMVPALLALGRKRLTGPKTVSEVAALTGSRKGRLTRQLRLQFDVASLTLRKSGMTGFTIARDRRPQLRRIRTVKLMSEFAMSRRSSRFWMTTSNRIVKCSPRVIHRAPYCGRARCDGSYNWLSSLDATRDVPFNLISLR